MPNWIQQSWSRPKAIAVATDLTDLDYLLPQARAQAKAGGAVLWLLHVIPPEVYGAPKSGAYPFVNQERAFRDAEASLAKIAEDIKNDKIPCRYEVRRWFAAEEVKSFVQERGIDRLILGTSGKGKLGKFLLGSVAEELIRSLEIPVCTIGPHVVRNAQITGSQMLYCTSLHHDLESSLQFALDLASACASTLTILHVVEDGAHSDQEIDAHLKLDYLLRHNTSAESLPDILERHGDAAEEILSETSSQGSDLLILGAVPASNLVSSIHPGVAYKVITKAPCPVLTLREHAAGVPVKTFGEAAVNLPSGY